MSHDGTSDPEGYADLLERQTALIQRPDFQEAAAEDQDPSLAYWATYPEDPEMFSGGADRVDYQAPEEDEEQAGHLDGLQAQEEDDDPQCVCGTYRSEHQLCGCPEGFQTAAAWAAEHAIIVSMSATDYEKYYGG